MNSPRQVLSRKLHSDYFNAVSDYQMREWIPNIINHIQHCKSTKCRYYKTLQDDGRLTLMSFRFNSEYFNFLEREMNETKA